MNSPKLRAAPRDTLVGALIACAVALIGAPHSATSTDQALSDTLTSEQAARLIGIAPRPLTRGAYQELLLPTGTRRLAFSRRLIEASQMRQRATRGEERYPWLKPPNPRRRR